MDLGIARPSGFAFYDPLVGSFTILPQMKHGVQINVHLIQVFFGFVGQVGKNNSALPSSQMLKTPAGDFNCFSSDMSS